MFKTLTGNDDQLWAQLTTLFAAGGPIVALLLQLGLPADQVTNWIKVIQAILIIAPLIIKIVHDRTANSPAALTLSASTVPGVKVTVDTMAADAAVTAVANDPTNAIKAT